MVKGGKKETDVTLSKKDKTEMLNYLDGADPTRSHVPVAGTFINWGTAAPDPRVVMQHYKNAQFPLPDPDSKPSESGSGGGAGGAGGSSSCGAAWKKNVTPDGNGGYFYFDPNWGKKMACELSSEKTANTTRLVFVDAQGKNWQADHRPPGKEPASMAKAGNQQQPSASLSVCPAPAVRPTATPAPSNHSNTKRK
ncbi:hypothetical protein N658DRAFT_482860 [Parathielavia hyrcaniae]|uniref:Uncharacterized protein n=1 Tax=Parathielavia hyrcaniae TaxID=113614 RepID=A0AAN6Q856_9PEZI|nr:hypothetical protein N658DRAFT_482860 [Parathielavia hyrcaniae]